MGDPVMNPEAQEKFDALLETMADPEEENLFRGLLFGTDGIGKTILAMAIAQKITPPDKKIAFIDSHTGYSVVMNPRWQEIKLSRRTKRLRFKDYGQLETLSNVIQRSTRPEYSEMNFGTVIIDELSSVVKKDIQRIHQAHKDADKKDVDDDVPGWGEYNPAKNRYMVMMEKLFEANTNVIAVSHQREDMDKAKQRYVNPDFIPSIQKEIIKPFNFCGYMTADMVSNATGGVLYERLVQVHPTKLISGPKTKIDDLSLQVNANDLPKIIEEWLNGHRRTLNIDNSVYSDPSVVFEDDPGVVVD